MTNPADVAIFVVGTAIIVIALGVLIGLWIKNYWRRRLRRRREVGAATYVARPVGRMVRSAMPRSFLAIIYRLARSSSFAASSKTSYCAERISASMIETAKSFCPRLTRPATRYRLPSLRGT
jgi:hypothetical protein